MENCLNEIRLHLKILSSQCSFNKDLIIDSVKFFSDKIWQDILFEPSFVKKTSFLQFFLTNKDESVTNKGRIYLKKKLTDNFLNVCLEEYIYGRKLGINQKLVRKAWQLEFWKKLEYFFEGIIDILEKKKDIFSYIFMFFECVRFDKFSSIYLNSWYNQQNKQELFRFYLKFVPKHQQKILKKIIQMDFQNKILKFQLLKPRRFFSGYFKDFFSNPFIIKDDRILCPFLKYSNSFIGLYSSSFRKISHNLSISGILNYDIFWIKKVKRIFHKLLLNLIVNKIEQEIETVKEYLKIEIKSYRLRNINHWHIQFKKKNSSNFEKFAMIISSCIMSLNNQSKTFIKDLALFGKISLWSKFVIGYFFSSSKSNQKNFYEFFPGLIHQNSISEYLRGGVILGLISNIKKNYEFERSFLNESKKILITNESPILRYSVFLSLSLVISGGIRHPEKSDLFFEMKNSVNLDEISSEGASLAIGLLFLGSCSFYLLKELLLLISESYNETKSRILITSISFVFYKNRGFCNYLFKKLIKEKNPQIRQGALVIYCLGNFMNAELQNLKILLELLSNESDDNVKFAIVLSIGFIYISRFELIGEVLLQFINHFNPFIRLGFCFALTLSSLGLKNNAKQLKILHKLTRDRADFVSQGACFCLGLIHFHSLSKKGARKTVKVLKSIINNTLESKITKFGALIGLSILEAKKKSPMIINKKIFQSPEILFLFLQYWNWLPNICFGFELLR